MPRVQRLLSSQNRRIDQLVDKIKQQQDKLEKQSVHLNALQRKVSRKPTEAGKTNPATSERLLDLCRRPPLPGVLVI